LAFPEAREFFVRKSNVTEDVKALLESFENGASINYQSVEGKSFIFICAHASMDSRCGYCGPRLYSQFGEKLQAAGSDNFVVSQTSHVGGHKVSRVIFCMLNEKGTD
jgi:hypothetical protein